MATVVHNSPAADTQNGLGFFLGVILLVALVFMFIYFGLPALNRTGGGGGNAPAPANQNTQGGVNVPDDIKVDINTPQ